MNILSALVSTISNLPIKTLVYVGPEVYSAGANIFSSFEKRFAFSEFLIHKCMPLKGMPRTEEFEQFDQQVWKFMSKRMKISFEDLKIIATRGKCMSAEEALEIGLVHEIIKDSGKEDYRKYIPINDWSQNK